MAKGVTFAIPAEKWRELRFEAIVAECEKDPLLAIKVYQYLEKNKDKR
jgi:hypothetical protein